MENSADEIQRGEVDLHNENPAEEMNYHGIIAAESNDLEGANYGYPACFSAWSTENIPDNVNITVGSQFGGIVGTPYEDVTEATSMEEVDMFCRNERQAASLVFPSHTAPLDIKFKQDGSVAYVTFHGSWCVFKSIFSYWFSQHAEESNVSLPRHPSTDFCYITGTEALPTDSA